ncbi:hypothetical protein AB395_0000736 [Sinorhizobium fredii CCBAU 45436]|nr:hypothetical protein SF83666_c07050 [Sinorhizobium fredii CCBAU 83666]AWI56414.1 hypothetical protein AB395_0000736 [Sinorhizobium fredii CCBAU 45436]AWM24210.1 hypothetical protein AOX55_0000933 [Sinorhizobium fredii CCBAU 25509]
MRKLGQPFHCFIPLRFGRGEIFCFLVIGRDRPLCTRRAEGSCDSRSRLTIGR